MFFSNSYNLLILISEVKLERELGYLPLIVDKMHCYYDVQVGNEIKMIKTELKKKKSLLQMDELKCRKRVLRRMGYCTASDVIELKGRVACEISRCC